MESNVERRREDKQAQKQCRKLLRKVSLKNIYISTKAGMSNITNAINDPGYVLLRSRRGYKRVYAYGADVEVGPGLLQVLQHTQSNGRNREQTDPLDTKLITIQQAEEIIIDEMSVYRDLSFFQ